MDVGVRSSRIVMAPGTPMSAMKEATPRSGTKLPTRCTAPRSPDDSPEKILREDRICKTSQISNSILKWI